MITIPPDRAEWLLYLIGDEDNPGPLYGIKIEYFIPKIIVNEDSDCWEWTAARGGSGYYGTFGWRYRLKGLRCKNQRPAHVITYMIFKGLIPENKQIDHRCRVHICVNPEHLEAVTAKINQRRGYSYNKSHCVNGHERTKENIYVDPTRSFRECMECRRENVRRYRSRKREVM